MDGLERRSQRQRPREKPARRVPRHVRLRLAAGVRQLRSRRRDAAAALRRVQAAPSNSAQEAVRSPESVLVQQRVAEFLVCVKKEKV